MPNGKLLYVVWWARGYVAGDNKGGKTLMSCFGENVGTEDLRVGSITGKHGEWKWWRHLEDLEGFDIKKSFYLASFMNM